MILSGRQAIITTFDCVNDFFEVSNLDYQVLVITEFLVIDIFEVRWCGTKSSEFSLSCKHCVVAIIW